VLSTPTQADTLLEAQQQVLEMIVRGRPLPEVLDALCRIVETYSENPVRAEILLPDLAAGVTVRPPEPGSKAAVSVPIMSSLGTVLGTFSARLRESREPQPHELRLVEVMARTAALAIERQRSDEALHASARSHRFFAELSAATQPLIEASALMAVSARMLAEHLSVDRCAYAEVEDERVFVITGDYSRGVPSIVGRWDVAAFGPACVQKMLAGEPYIVYDVDTDPRIGPEDLPAYRATTIRAVVCVPLHKLGRFTAAMAVHQTAPRHWTAAEIELVGQVVARCWEALERASVARSREAANQILAHNRARLDYAVRLSGIGFWYCDLPFDELVWDARVKEHFFFAPEARITIDDFYGRMHPDDRQPTREAIDASIGKRTSYDVVYRTMDPRSSAIKWIRALGGAAYAADGSATHFDGVTVDVTELREQDRRKDEFLATLAHELRNPLAPIRTGLEILNAGASAEQAAKVREMMQRQLAHLVRMVDDLLDISRVTLGKVTLKKERVDFRAVLNSALETARPLIEAERHELAVRLPSYPLPLTVDPTRLAQVIANLLNNSAKYTPASGRIQLSAEAEGATLVIEVSDTGVGIPAEMLPKVFDMFIQVGRSIERSQGGLGIGLTLVRRLVEMHGGSVHAESPGVGQGSTFTVRLPLADSGHESLGSKVDAKSEGDGLRVLIVDDNLDAAASLAMLLELSGHRTHLAHTGEAALAAAAEFQPHAMFLDIGLPDQNGYEVARRLRADPRIAKSLLLVALTGWGAAEDKRQAQAAGFDRHLVKPVDMSRLSEVLGGVSLQ
jgi:signal transduction histidine kinase/CheY-like chemotaxis protein